MKNYQNTTRRAGTGRTTPKKARRDAARDASESAIALPDTVTVALLAFAVGAGLKVLDVILESEITALAGPTGRQDPNRTAVRHGPDHGLVTLGGRQVTIRRPRLRSVDRTTEVPLPTYELASSTELLGRETLNRMLANLSTRHYKVGLEPMGEKVAARTRSVSKSAVSRRFVAMTESARAELMSADLSGLDLVAIMIDGANFGQHLLWATGMRVGEVLSLDDSDVDLAHGVLRVREAKFNKSRELPMHDSTVAALHAYWKRRIQLLPDASPPAFFVSAAGTRVLYCNFHLGFQDLVRRAGIEARPRRAAPGHMT